MPQRGRSGAEQTNRTKTEQNALEELQEKPTSPVTAGDSPSTLLTQHRTQQDSLWGQPTGGTPTLPSAQELRAGTAAPRPQQTLHTWSHTECAIKAEISTGEATGGSPNAGEIIQGKPVVSKEKTRHWLEWKGNTAVQAHETGRLGWPGGRGVRGAGTGEAPRTRQTRGAASGQQSGPTPEGRKEGIKRRSDSTSLKTTEKIHDARSRVRHSLMGALSPCGPGPLPWAASPCALQACWGSRTIAPPLTPRSAA